MSSCFVLFKLASALSGTRSAGRFGGGGCFGCFGSSFTVVSVLVFGVSVEAFAAVSALGLGRFCNCSSSFFGGCLCFFAAASFARCSRTIAGGPLTGCDGVDDAAGASGTGCSFGMDFASIRCFCSFVFRKTSRTTLSMAASFATASRSIEAVVPAVLSSGLPSGSPGYRRCA